MAGFISRTNVKEPMAPKRGLVQMVLEWLRTPREEAQPVSRDMAEEVNKMLPEEISGRDAVLKRRKHYADIDKMLEDANR